MKHIIRQIWEGATEPDSLATLCLVALVFTLQGCASPEPMFRNVIRLPVVMQN